MSGVDTLIKQIKVMFDPERLRAVVDFLIRKNYNKGLTTVEDKLELNVNVMPNKDVVQFISNYTFDLVKGMNDDLMNKMQAELSRGLMNGESKTKLKERVMKVMKVSEARAKAITRTETHRAHNAGGLEAARQSGLKLRKEWFNPDPQADVCKHLAGKTVGLEEPFKYNGEEFLTPPAHVNCRSRIIYVQEDEVETKVKYIRRTGTSGNYRYYYNQTGVRRARRQPKSPEYLKALAEKLDKRVKASDKKAIMKNVAEWQAGRDTQGLLKKDGQYPVERQKKHINIMKHYKKSADQAKAQGQPRVLFMAGLPASGKTYSAKKYLKKVPGDKLLFEDNEGRKYINLNADDIKEHLPEYNRGLGATIVHEESSDILNIMIAGYRNKGYNIIIDGTMKTASGAEQKLDAFEKAGYRSELFFVDVEPEEAMKRAAKRYRSKGRYVPYEFIAKAHPKVLASVEKVKGRFDSYIHMDNNGRVPRRVE